MASWPHNLASARGLYGVGGRWVLKFLAIAVQTAMHVVLSAYRLRLLTAGYCLI